MNDPIAPQIANPEILPLRAASAPSPLVERAARWFWWIAGLSLINTIMSVSGSNSNFVMGLGFTAVSDTLFAANKGIGFAIDAVALGFFIFLGFQAKQGKLWAFYLGIAAYVLDALIYAVAQDWMPVAFHALAIFFISKGVMSLRAARRGNAR
jgi:hypothetical protein